MAVGILALQGGFDAHKKSVEALGRETLLVRNPEDLAASGSLIIPGGESTVMMRLLKRFGLYDDLALRIKEGMPVFGTCAGMILLSSGVEGSDQETLEAMDYRVRRNAYGRQSESFETILSWRGDGVPALFIRAPEISSCGHLVDVQISYEKTAVLVRQANCLAASFHPELTGFSGIHRYFLEEMAGSPISA